MHTKPTKKLALLATALGSDLTAKLVKEARSQQKRLVILNVEQLRWVLQLAQFHNHKTMVAIDRKDLSVSLVIKRHPQTNFCFAQIL